MPGVTIREECSDGILGVASMVQFRKACPMGMASAFINGKQVISALLLGMKLYRNLSTNHALALDG